MASTSTVLNVSEDTLDDLNGRFLTFYIDKTFYGIELAHVIEIISVQPVTRIPNLPHYIKGIINLRGKVVPVIDVRLKFNQPERPYDDKTCIIVVTIDEMHVGLIVDSVAEVVTIDRNNCSPPPDLGNGAGDKYLRSIAKVGSKVVLNIDIERFFASELRTY